MHLKLHSLLLLFREPIAPFFLSQHTMPKSSKGARSYSDAQDASWVKETKDRLDKVASIFDAADDKGQPEEMKWMQAGTQDLGAFRRGEPIASTDPALVRSAEQTAELVYRASNEGLQSTGFNPWRHTHYVTGRPVQVYCNVGSLIF